MVVTGATLTAVAVPYRPEAGTLVTAGLELTEARHVILQLHTDQGLTGLGEAVPRPSVYGETLESITAAMRDLLLPPVLGLDPLDVEKVWARWSRVVANTTAKAAIDMALHDVAGQMAQMPLYKMLGGWSDGRVHSVAVPLLLDESITTSADVLWEIQLGNAGALSIRSPRSGFTATRKMLGLAEAASVPCLVGSHRELGVGTAASAHLAAAYRCMRYPAELGVHATLEDGLLEEPIQIVGGWLTTPTGPGLGVRLDAAKVAHYRIWSTSVGEIGA